MILNRKRVIAFFLLALILAFIFIFKYFIFEDKGESDIPVVSAKSTSVYKKKPDNPLGMSIPYSSSLVFSNFQNKNNSLNIKNFFEAPEEPIFIAKELNFNEEIIKMLGISPGYDGIIREIDKYECKANECIFDDFVIKKSAQNNRHQFTKSEGIKFLLNKSYSLQVAVKSSENECKKEWDVIFMQFGSIIKQNSYVIEKIFNDDGSVMFALLITGYKTWNEAELVCKKLVYQNYPCIIKY